MNISGTGGKKFQPGNHFGRRWQQGQSGNPAGKSKAQREFEEGLADALAGENPRELAKELAELVWKAARKGEAWAITMLLARLAPEPLKIRMEVTRGENEIDFSRLSDEQIDQLEEIFERLELSGPAGVLESGEGPAPSA